MSEVKERMIKTFFMELDVGKISSGSTLPINEEPQPKILMLLPDTTTCYKWWVKWGSESWDATYYPSARCLVMTFRGIFPVD